MPHEQCPMAEVLSGKIPETHDAEVFIERPDGSRMTVVVNIRPLKNERGEITGAINCFYDITARKQAEEAQRRIEVLAATNRKLHGEIMQRQAVEASLKQSEQHQRDLLAQSRQMQEQLRNLSRQVLHAQEEAVSYTHLDVYKRQMQRRNQSEIIQHRRAQFTRELMHDAVSYTHLDVYKRQKWMCCPPKHNAT